MRRILTCLFVLFYWWTAANAVAAYPYPTTVTQPDGTTVTVKMHGDEWFHYTTTTDGYTVVKNDNGYWVYAQAVDGKLAPTTHIARDAAKRTEADKEYLQGVSLNLAPGRAAGASLHKERAKEMALPAKSPAIDLKKFKGLIILVNYSDQTFSSSDPKTLFTNLVSQRNYTGYDSSIPYTGSVRDYFYDNSMGQFDPSFTVVGPVSVNYSSTYPQQTSTQRVLTLWKAVLDAADSQVDFSQFDTNNDGYVDMVYFIVAGYGSNYDSSTKYLWPHAWNVQYYASDYGLNFDYDGVTVGRYACSTEFYGTTSDHTIDGIGTICHEFGHVLGQPDLYDTDYDDNGQSNDPGEWSIMASGSYLNHSRTPAGYGIYERYALDWMLPTVINDNAQRKVFPMQKFNAGYRINSTVDNEFFLLENRCTNTKWDKYLPGSGMLVWRTDSTNASIWKNNKVNVDTAHNYFELVRAKQGTKVYYGTTYKIDSDSDPFPGSGNITELNNSSSSPSIRSWTGSNTPITLFNITQDNDTVIFNCYKPITTLADIEANGVDGKSYTVTDVLKGVYADTYQTNVLYAKDDNNSIDKSEPASGQTIYDKVADFDQSNWVKLYLPSSSNAANFVGKSITTSTVSGTYSTATADSYGPVGPALTLTNAPTASTASAYTPNLYNPANFAQQSEYFLVKPKNLEYAKVHWAVYAGDGEFVVPQQVTGASGNTNGYNLAGSFTVNMGLYENDNTKTADDIFVKNQAYSFPAIIGIKPGTSSPLPAPKKIAAGNAGTKYNAVIYPLTSGDIITGVDETIIGKNVTSVKYYNLTGVESSTPFNGVNIVVKQCDDGTSSISKQIIKTE